MAEIIAEMQERMLPEYEQLKKFEICSDEQIRDCIRKRENFQTKLTQRDKNIQIYLDMIIYEKKVHKWITQKEHVTGTKLAGLKTSIATRIIRLYREGLRQFPHEQRFWNNYIEFSKKSVPHEVQGIYEKMLTFHGDKAEVWRDAALWAYEYGSNNLSKVKDIFFRALQRHPESEIINNTFFKILLHIAANMNSEKILANNTSEQDIGLEQAEIVYRNSKKKISNITYFISLLKICEEEFVNITAGLQKMILDDLMDMFPRNEQLWDILAQRELKGLNMSDLQSYTKTGEKSSNSMDIEEQEDVKDISLTNKTWYQKRTLKRRIELCCGIYQNAVRTLQTNEMWSLYIDAMLKLNQDMSTQQVLKRKRLAIAFKEGHESGLMSVDHYCIFIKMLSESNSGADIIESVLSEAVKHHKSLKLYEVWLSTYIVANNEPKVYEIFRKADKELGVESFPLWRYTLMFYKTRYDDSSRLLKQLYKEACKKIYPEFGIFKGEYLEFCVLNMPMNKARAEYDELCKIPPPCLEMHQKMAQLESNLVARTKEDFDRWRLCHKNSVFFFGKTHSKVWIDYIKFERDHGEPKRMSMLYEEAKETLDTALVDNFISEYTLLNAII